MDGRHRHVEVEAQIDQIRGPSCHKDNLRP